jgi:hypothetical protein
MELGMREPYIEGVAIHGDPESCRWRCEKRWRILHRRFGLERETDARSSWRRPIGEEWRCSAWRREARRQAE